MKATSGWKNQYPSSEICSSLKKSPFPQLFTNFKNLCTTTVFLMDMWIGVMNVSPLAIAMLCWFCFCKCIKSSLSVIAGPDCWLQTNDLICCALRTTYMKDLCDWCTKWALHEWQRKRKSADISESKQCKIFQMNEATLGNESFFSLK